MKLVQADSQEHLQEARSLFLEYASSVGFDLSFQNFGEELANLPGEYSSPTGALLLALEGDGVAGCVALRKLGTNICEMKRLFVRPAFRRKGIGRKLSTAIIELAKKRGYSSMRLDTVGSMGEAIQLYRSLGFKEIQPYRYNPMPGALFLELDL
jgi:ribosomal protein S18 acetylase RimI-like enzyme